ncbi:ATP-binding cassette domain-containing protein, partial [Rossellomorea marisflavi]
GSISQGQKQLLSIARAILSDPSILVLDEATSSIDTITEMKIQEALKRLMEGRTSVVVAHRLNTIRQADQILVLDGGKIIERGSHDHLIKLGGFYAGLYHSQLKESI